MRPLIPAAVFLVSGDEMTVMLELLVLFGLLIISLLLQTLFRPHSNADLFRLEVLGLVVCAISVYCATYFFNSEVTTWGKIGIAVLVVIVNIGVVAYFALNVLAEILRRFLDLDDLHREEVLRLLESRAWPVVAFMTGRSGAVVKGIFLRIVLLVEKRVARKLRAGSLRKTKERLDAMLNETVRTANWRERLRRTTNVANWAMQGLIQTPEVAEMVADYEVRKSPHTHKHTHLPQERARAPAVGAFPGAPADRAPARRRRAAAGTSRTRSGWSW